MSPEPDAPATIGALLSAVADTHPDRVALEVGRDRSTHAALALAARAVSATLRALPERRRVPAVVVLSRGGREGIQAMLGAWSAGLAAAPIAPDLPAPALARAITTLAPFAVFVDGASRAALPALLPLLPAGLPVVLPDPAAARTVRAVGERTPVVGVERRPVAGGAVRPARPADPAAHLWLPDAAGGAWVARSHAALLADVRRHATLLALHGGDRVSHLHPLDGLRGVVDLLLPWSVGAAACAPDPDAHRRRGWLREARLTVLRLTPTRLRRMAASGALQAGVLGGLRAVVLEGEGHRGADVADLRACAPHAVIDAVYGREEVGSAVLVHRVQPGPPAAPGALAPLGRPFPGVRVAVTDARGAPAPPDRVGWLFVVGPGGAPVPTGERVQVEAGGQLRAAGRADDQVQLRGRRVSLDAIGAVFAALAGAPAVAVGWPLSAPGCAQGIVVFVQGAGIDGPHLLERAAPALPRAELPSELLVVPGLPARPDGAPDRGRLTRFLAGRDLR